MQGRGNVKVVDSLRLKGPRCIFWLFPLEGVFLVGLYDLHTIPKRVASGGSTVALSLSIPISLHPLLTATARIAAPQLPTPSLPRNKPHPQFVPSYPEVIIEHVTEYV